MFLNKFKSNIEKFENVKIDLTKIEIKKHELLLKCQGCIEKCPAC